ncbi:uncharacterized protein EAF02_010595 [Botrytis sinoallii]|uniref:uncharacterized protein n=1 Tax=Botrytis sinoallii TaxID=1463999 RepID=UPI00190125C1|nr:uncharacterized protein EAF02_010595 [Botrytis sinoallii]KAF7861641.1 hypothetical protein EAF02_010595 [Botrytis sinoallii]
MSKGLGNVPNRLGLNYGNKASKVKKSSSSPFQRMQDKIKGLERRLEEQCNQNEKKEDKVKELEKRLEEQYNQNEKKEDKMKELEQRPEEQHNQNKKIQDKVEELERRLKEQNDRNETMQKTRDQKFEYYNGQIEKLDESVQKLTNWTSQLKARIDEDIQRQDRENEALNTMQNVQHAMQKVLATVMEQQHKHISDMIAFQTQLPDIIRGELAIQKAFNPEPLLDRDPDLYAKPN